MSKIKGRKSSGRMASKGFPNPVDVFVGQRIRERRIELGLSQTALADALGVTFQQVQKYEQGANRISASRMVDCAAALQVGPGWFFEGMPADVAKASPGKLHGKTPPQITPDQRLLRADLETFKKYHALPAGHRVAVGRLVRSLAAHAG